MRLTVVRAEVSPSRHKQANELGTGHHDLSHPTSTNVFSHVSDKFSTSGPILQSCVRRKSSPSISRTLIPVGGQWMTQHSSRSPFWTRQSSTGLFVHERQRSNSSATVLLA